MGNLGKRIALELLGTRIDVAVSDNSDAGLVGTIEQAWERCLADESTPAERTVEVVLDEESLLDEARSRGAVADSDPDRLMSTLSSRLTVTAIESRHGELLMLHACALADPATGNTIVLIAPSGTGKTTAALTLGTELGYLTDECVGIDMDDNVVPYPKPLSILCNGEFPKQQVSPAKLGLHDAPDSARVVALALLDRTDVPVTPAVELVPTLEGLAAIAGQSSALQKLPKPLHHLAELLERTGGLRRLTYHEVMDTAPIVDELVRGGGR